MYLATEEFEKNVYQDNQPLHGVRKEYWNIISTSVDDTIGISFIKN
jgi:hypothetical protein